MRIASAALEELRSIPFLARGLAEPRVVPSTQFYVDGNWHSWLFLGGSLQKVICTPVEGHYFGDVHERPTDQRFPLLELVAQHTLTRNMYRSYCGIWNDLQNLGASLAKFKLYYRCREQGHCWSRFVGSGIEYVVTVCRSVFDLLQELVAAHWDKTEPAGPRKKRRLPASFAKVALNGDGIRSAAEIRTKYGLLPELADWYVAQAPFLLQLRRIRDRLVHGGDTLEFIFMAERGMAVIKDTRPFCELYSWPADCVLPNGLVPLRPVVCRAIQRTLQACDGFAAVFRETVQLPSEMAPGLHFYSRGYHDHELQEIGTIVDNSLWCDGRLNQDQCSAE